MLEDRTLRIKCHWKNVGTLNTPPAPCPRPHLPRALKGPLGQDVPRWPLTPSTSTQQHPSEFFARTKTSEWHLLFAAKIISYICLMQIVDTFLLAVKTCFWAKFWSEKKRQNLGFTCSPMTLDCQPLGAQTGNPREQFLGTELTLASWPSSIISHLEAWAPPLGVLSLVGEETPHLWHSSGVRNLSYQKNVKTHSWKINEKACCYVSLVYFFEFWFLLNRTQSKWGCLKPFYYCRRIVLRRVPLDHGNEWESCPQELWLKYCLQRVGRCLGARIKDQTKKVDLKTTQPQTVELGMNQETLPPPSISMPH